MALDKSPNSMCQVALVVVVLLLASQIMSSDAASTPKGMIEGTITPIEGGGALRAPTEDVRPTTPSHSPGIGHGHAFTNNNNTGRKLFAVSQ